MCKERRGNSQTHTAQHSGRPLLHHQCGNIKLNHEPRGARRVHLLSFSIACFIVAVCCIMGANIYIAKSIPAHPVPSTRYVQFLHYNNNNKYRLEKVRMHQQEVYGGRARGFPFTHCTGTRCRTHSRWCSPRAKCAQCMNAMSVLNAIVLYRTGSRFCCCLLGWSC